MECHCQFSDFCRQHMVFLHLFVSKWKKYIKWKTWSKICADAHNIFAHLHERTKKVSHDFEMVVLHVYQTNEFLSWSDMDNSKRPMPFEHMHDKLSRSYCTSTKRMSFSHEVIWTTLKDQWLLSICMTNFLGYSWFFFTTLGIKMECHCQFSDFCRQHMVFLHLFVSK